jgi:hypothetical protein
MARVLSALLLLASGAHAYQLGSRGGVQLGVPTAVDRRAALATGGGVASLLFAAPPRAFAAASAAEARAQLGAAMKTADDLLERWDDVIGGGGDSIRRQLGTVGTTSPLFQIDKVRR